MEPRSSKKLGEILIEKGVLSASQLKIALAIQKKEGGLLGEILIKQGFVKNEDILEVFSQHLDYIYVSHNPIKTWRAKLAVILTSVVLCLGVLWSCEHVSFLKSIDQRLYGWLLRVEYMIQGPPHKIRDVVIVAIDNDTVLHMKDRWPYPRADFAKVLENVKKANPLAIGIDFAYLGKSNPEDDEAIKKALDYPQLILAATINEHGYLDTSYVANLEPTYGIVTKLQDEDGIVRRNLIYLMGQGKEAYLSWEMQLLKLSKDLDMTSFADHRNRITFQTKTGSEKWDVPVDTTARSFLIHFQAHTKDFEIISFYNALFDNFDPALIKNKIVLVGVLPSIFQDIQHTAFGWLPGVILNANAFLTLYTQDFLKEIPRPVQYTLTTIIAALTCLFLLGYSRFKSRVVIALEVCLFTVLSYFLLEQNYVLHYLSFPLAIIICPLLARKIFSKSSFGL
jgi:CHASE2 domain-containing sensor protein